MGMAPSASKMYMPSSYGFGTVLPAHADSPEFDSSQSPNDQSETSTHDANLAAAVQEWCSIRRALNVLGSHLGPGYQALDAAYAGAGDMPSPFGRATTFQRFDIAVLNAMYLMCGIILYRSHPSMPPASMVAQGVAAQFTAEAAAKIGQIAAGIFLLAGTAVHIDEANPTPVSGLGGGQAPKPLNPSIGGMLCEITMPLFFAGVQFQSPVQRAWLVSHLHGIEVRTGFATAGMIAHGCETAWKRTADAGRGMPYERSGFWRRDEVPGQPVWAKGVRGEKGMYEDPGPGAEGIRLGTGVIGEMP